jgi:hypothetical protein
MESWLPNPARFLTNEHVIGCMSRAILFKFLPFVQFHKSGPGMTRFLSIVLLLLSASFGLARAAQASIYVEVDRSEQLMRVYVENELYYVWPVSTGRGRYRTPAGQFQPYSLRRHHRSSKYNNAPMPYSIFYRGGYAIHGTDAIHRLGSPASHGCVRLHMANARELFALVQEFGKHATRIVISP